jgi:hypothetical protein
MEDVAALVEDAAPKLAKRGSYKPRQPPLAISS